MRSTFSSLSRRRFLAGATGLSAAALLAACGVAQAPTDAPEADDAPKSEDMPKAEPATVNVRWIVNVAENAQAFEDGVINRFREMHPDINLNYEGSPYRAHYDKMLAELAANEAIDILTPDPTRWIEWTDKGFVREVTDLYKRDQSQLGDTVALDWIIDPQGRFWSMPYTALGTIHIYNTSIFDKYGISEPPRQWNASDGGEYVDVAREITSRSSSEPDPIWGIYTGADYTTEMSTYIVQNGANFLSDDLRRATMHEPEFIEAIQFMYDLEFKYRVAPTADERAAFVETLGEGRHRDALFVHGRAAMNNTWFNAESGWTHPDVENLPMKAVPMLESSKGGPTSDKVAGWTAVQYMWSGAKHPDAVWEFMKFAMSDIEFGVAVTTLLNYGLSANAQAWDDPRLVATKTRPPREISAIATPLREGRGFITQIFPGWREHLGFFNEQKSLVWKQELTVEEAMQNASKHTQAVIDAYWADKE